ncbi:hypothetical protein ACH50O_05200 [Methylomonas sp. 2BW1-5-20]|uniref:hypothetical protein n=1 Tax=Methylomonas sp. 2BW1-5-20 TaxID=3376686 RepID=UPI00404C4E3B
MTMQDKNVHPDLIQVALEKVEGLAFESFAQDFLSVLEGRNFVPLGGTKDGGADGLYQCENARIFYQFTKQENHRNKIRKTVERLNEFGRTVTTLYYLSPRVIPHIDKEEDLLSEELDVRVKIRDRKYISSHINDSIGTIAAYNNHLSVFTQFLERVARSDESFISSHVQDPSAFVFLQHEVTNRLGNRKLIHSLTDSMILLALSETDPDTSILMSESEITSKIFDRFPWTTKLLKNQIQQRLEKLRTKDEAGREVRWYQKEKKYCLPYNTRLVIKEENQSDESLKIKFIEEVKLMASELFDSDDGEYQKIADLCSEVVHSVFEKQGLLFSHFLVSNEKNIAPPIVSDCIDDAIERAGYPNSSAINYREHMETIIRKVFYHASPNQREYLTNLSRTYVLLFALQADPKIIEYFSSMAASFRLFLGSDILVKALSERYLDNEDQVARNLLKMASASGIKMYLSECVLEEVFQHIKGTYYEFINYFCHMEPYITKEIARNSGKILIRSYFYAKEEGRVKSWTAYLGQFITYSNIDNQYGIDELKKYLLSEYNLSFIENSELESCCNGDAVNSLAEAMLTCDDKKNSALAHNTALLVHGIYGLRTKYKEQSSVSEFGLKTWWMTNQTRVLRHTVDIVKTKRAQYIMKPEYILNYIAMSPNCSQVREGFKTIFPSVFGIQLGHRLRDDVFHNIMNDVQEWKDYEPGRVTALMSELSDRLKCDRLRRYNLTLDEEGLSDS